MHVPTEDGAGGKEGLLLFFYSLEFFIYRVAS